MLSPAEFERRAKKIRALVLDVDGVLTDGAILIDSEGNESKSFGVRDGLGIRFWLDSGGKLAILSGRNSRAVEHRARELGIDPVILGAGDKRPHFAGLLQRWGLAAEAVCVLCDDLPDLPLLHSSGIGATVADDLLRLGEVDDVVKFLLDLYLTHA